MDEVYESSDVGELMEALAKAQAEMKPAVLNRINPHFKSQYADLSSLRAATQILSKYGIAVTQTCQTEYLPDGMPVVSQWTRLSKGNQFIRSKYPLRWLLPQQMGSERTFARRYELSGITGQASDDDDDANAAQQDHPLQKLNPSQARKKGLYPVLEKECRAIDSLSELRTWWENRSDDIKSLPPQWIALIEEEKDRKKIELADKIEESGSEVRQDSEFKRQLRESLNGDDIPLEGGGDEA